MKITFDLDDVIFNMKPLMQQAFEMAGKQYQKNTNWDIRKIYTPEICDNLENLWASDILYEMPVLDPGIPYILNSLIKRPDMKILFVTERRLKQPEKTFQQLRNAGIHCSIEQVYDEYGLKSDILKKLKPDIHFDDSPFVVQGCLDKGIPVIMISNNATLYNHHLRGKLKYYPNLRTALFKEGIYRPNGR